MNPQKKAFADLIISGTPPTEAALSAFEGISRKTAYNKSSLLQKDKEVLDYIREKREEIGKQIQTQIEQEDSKFIQTVADKKATKILTSMRKRQLLDEIAEGKKTYEKVIVIDGKIKRVKCKPTPSERLKAIELDNKMSGDMVLAKRPEIKDAQEVEKLLIVEDQTQPPQHGNKDV